MVTFVKFEQESSHQEVYINPQMVTTLSSTGKGNSTQINLNAPLNPLIYVKGSLENTILKLTETIPPKINTQKISQL